MTSAELTALVGARQLDEREALEVLRNPHCSVEVAERLADSRQILQSHATRELLAGFRGLPFGRAMDLMATLPWTSLLAVAQNPRSAPVVKRHAEKKLLYQLPSLTLGEKVALARRVHRPLLRTLLAHADGAVLAALLDNPRLVENDILVILHTVDAPAGFYAEIARHRRWGHYYGVRRALVECLNTPLPIALAALVQLRMADLSEISGRPDLAGPVRAAARALKEKGDRGLRGVITS
jgi:hypothetical protein